jgi:predicted alpha/beta-fold hydrolase
VLESGWFVYRHYFIRKWKRSLALKQQLFPRRFDFTGILGQQSITTMTEHLVERYSEYGNLEEYLDSYAIVGDRLAGLRVPSEIVFALDDPIIPAADLHSLASTPYLSVTAVPRGGHCGFTDRLRGESWADRRAARALLQD